MTSLTNIHQNNSNSLRATPARTAVSFVKHSFAAIAFIAGAAAMGTANAAGPQKDPLAGDSWHAVTPSWPGTLVFDAKTKKVVLAPVGAEPMEATYSYTIKPATGAGKNQAIVEGTLRMTNKEGQVSDSTFSIKNSKDLTLQFAGVQNQEKYVRLSAKEQAAEQERLRKMILEGRVKPFTKP